MSPRTVISVVVMSQNRRTPSDRFPALGRTGSPGRSSELQPSRIALGSGPALGTMQSLRPVRCCCQVDRLWIQAILPDASLGKLDCVRIVRRDGMFNEF